MDRDGVAPSGALASGFTVRPRPSTGLPIRELERAARIELAWAAWKAVACTTRPGPRKWSAQVASIHRPPAPKAGALPD